MLTPPVWEHSFSRLLEIVHSVRQGTKTEVLDVWAFALSQEDKKKAEDWGTYHQRGQELAVSFFLHNFVYQEPQQ